MPRRHVPAPPWSLGRQELPVTLRTVPGAAGTEALTPESPRDLLTDALVRAGYRSADVIGPIARIRASTQPHSFLVDDQLEPRVLRRFPGYGSRGT
ncbi:hypothetical protein C8046_17740 [Serinibacter arcticus]|uniref:Uncharacterized protein n=1 Tax=Serinibacter arcticus TaxID=1655435 RepID=A0A2U1ZYZ9_9MICO|nr:hypothetical protein [Serinibacter arcticus]PWD52209.1 hypothetical protein C8046_17740 [Serinibacter arcticus]